jgi:hypothetical protein
LTRQLVPSIYRRCCISSAKFDGVYILVPYTI